MRNPPGGAGADTCTLHEVVSPADTILLAQEIREVRAATAFTVTSLLEEFRVTMTIAEPVKVGFVESVNVPLVMPSGITTEAGRSKLELVLVTATVVGTAGLLRVIAQFVLVPGTRLV